MKKILALAYLSLTLALSGETISVEINGQKIIIPEGIQKYSIEKFKQEDEKSPPALGGIVFAGSSTIQKWRGAVSEIAPLPAVNRGIGGTTTAQWLYLTEKLIIPYQPKLVVFFCGTNDLSHDSRMERATSVIENTQYIIRLIQEKNPGARILYLSITKCPSRTTSWPAMQAVNDSIKALAKKDKSIVYFEMNDITFDDQGKIREDLFEKDQVHLNHIAYKILSEKIKPIIESEWKKAN